MPTAFVLARFLVARDAHPHLTFETSFLSAHRFAFAIFGDGIACAVNHVTHAALGSSVTFVASAHTLDTFSMPKTSLGARLDLARMTLPAFSA